MDGKEVGGSEVIPSRDTSLSLLAEAWGDPLDTRSPQELAEQLGLDKDEVTKLLTDPKFTEPIRARFHQALDGARILIFKTLIRSAIKGDKAAVRTAAQALGLTGPQGGTTINMFAAGSVAGTQKDYITALSDQDLDAEIHRLLMVSHPDDLDYSGKALPTVFEEVLSDVDGKPEPGRDDLPGEAGETSPAPPGEDQAEG